MQDRYAGDIGDFGKLGLLRVLHASGLTIGVNWYLTNPTDKEALNRDGEHTDYLKDNNYCECDPELCRELKQVVAGNREVKALQNDAILPAVYFDKILDFSCTAKSERKTQREEWHQRALAQLDKLDVVFLDPDNGLLVPSAKDTKRENKFVKKEEIIKYYQQGSSVIYYQHKARRTDCFYVQQQQELLQSPELAGASGAGLKFKPTSQRYYFFIIQERHRKTIETALDEMLAGPWNKHFCEV